PIASPDGAARSQPVPPPPPFKRAPPPAAPAARAAEADKPQRPRPDPVTIDFAALEKRGFLTPNSPRARITDEFRLIKRQLLERAFTADPKDHMNAVMVSSSMPGEGKTFVTINLAMSLAKEIDLHVLVVDADLSRPGLSPTLGMKALPGLSDLLSDPSLDIADVLRPTNIPTLGIIPSGQPHRMGPELLASQRALSVISELAERYPDRLILIDTAPFLVSSEGMALKLQVGQILLVVEAERTTEQEVRATLDMIGDHEGVSVVLNATRTRFLSSLTRSKPYEYYLHK
ncbi:MAG TPA: chromosome partitioning protein ParA, partial [Rhodospirillum rubrum]|nr:chromosome partitioning protein ParA [Rhodospirillum rubrum]